MKNSVGRIASRLVYQIDPVYRRLTCGTRDLKGASYKLSVAETETPLSFSPLLAADRLVMASKDPGAVSESFGE
jgi:hypothetical protein